MGMGWDGFSIPWESHPMRSHGMGWEWDGFYEIAIPWDSHGILPWELHGIGRYLHEEIQYDKIFAGHQLFS